MTIEKWAKDFKSYVNALDMQRDDYNGIMEYIDDALAMLKEQELRVMTSSELQPNDLVWIEVPQSDGIWPALLQKTDWFDLPTWAAYYLHDGYGRDWRCWTAKPTDKQRRAVEWDDE